MKKKMKIVVILPIIMYVIPNFRPFLSISYGFRDSIFGQGGHFYVFVILFIIMHVIPIFPPFRYISYRVILPFIMHVIQNFRPFLSISHRFEIVIFWPKIWPNLEI